jgi:prevent-host-death family protein
MIATAKDLRFHLKEILDIVFRGQVVITYRAKPYAKIVPIEPSLKTVREKTN